MYNVYNSRQKYKKIRESTQHIALFFNSRKNIGTMLNNVKEGIWQFPYFIFRFRLLHDLTTLSIQISKCDIDLCENSPNEIAF